MVTHIWTASFGEGVICMLFTSSYRLLIGLCFCTCVGRTMVASKSPLIVTIAIPTLGCFVCGATPATTSHGLVGCQDTVPLSPHRETVLACPSFQEGTMMHLPSCVNTATAAG